jgi:hypothetical protein
MPSSIGLPPSYRTATPSKQDPDVGLLAEATTMIERISKAKALQR